MVVDGSLFRRCGCRDDAGKTFGVLPKKPTERQLARACPKMLRDPKHGRWSFRLSAGFDPSTGKRRQVNGGTYASETEARKARTAAANQLNQGKYLAPSRETLAQYLDKSLDRRSRMGRTGGKPLAPTTLENYRRYAAQDIAPSALGRMRLQDIRRTHVQAFVDELVASNRGATTVRRIVAVLQGVLSAAVRDELIDQTPARQLDLPPVRTNQFVPWDFDQIGRFLEVAGGHRLGVLFEVALFTGIRRAALVALLWEDVDFESREIRVRQDKTEAGKRRVALDQRTVGALQAWADVQHQERLAWGPAYQDSGRVFTMEDGRPLQLQYPTRLFTKLVTVADVPEMKLHGLRHLHASLQIAAGTPLVLVSKRMGHSGVGITADIYSHLLPSTEHAAAEAAAALVPKRGAGARTVHTQPLGGKEEAAPADGGNGL